MKPEFPPNVAFRVICAVLIHAGVLTLQEAQLADRRAIERLDRVPLDELGIDQILAVLYAHDFEP